jgi:K(+)-stimulated pyrophosphate-energized sodium pump
LSSGHSVVSYLRRAGTRSGGRTAALAALPLFAGLSAIVFALLSAVSPRSAEAAAPPQHGGEASLVLPDLGSVDVMGMNGRSLLLIGMLVAL